MSKINENNVIQAFKDEDPEAYKYLYERFYQIIYLFSYRLVRDKEQAKDIAQSSITKLFLKKQDFDSVANICSFLYLIARNEGLTYLKHLKVRDERRQELTHFLIHEKLINDQIDGEFIKKVYSASLNKLTDRMREIIELLYEEDLTHPEVAARLNISTHTVKNIRAKAIMRMRNHFDKSGLTPHIKEIIFFVLLDFGMAFLNK